MSYGAKPPSSPYGDQDFITEGNSSTSQTSGFQNQNKPSSVYGNLNQPLPQPPGSPYNLNPAPVNPQEQWKQLSSQITQEDLLFMRSFRRDTFLGVSVPIFVLSSGALFLYRRNKGIGQKVWQYVVLGVSAAVTGPILNRNELLRRLETNRSNSQYMETLRKVFGVRSQFSEMETESSSQLATNLGSELSDWSTPAQPSSFDTRLPNYSHTNLGSDQNQEIDGQNPNAPVRPVTYEELRARNRGYIK